MGHGKGENIDNFRNFMRKYGGKDFIEFRRKWENVTKMIFKKYDGRTWSVLMWLGMDTGAGLLWAGYRNVGFPKMRGWLTEWIPVSQEGLCVFRLLWISDIQSRLRDYGKRIERKWPVCRSQLWQKDNWRISCLNFWTVRIKIIDIASAYCGTAFNFSKQMGHLKANIIFLVCI